MPPTQPPAAPDTDVRLTDAEDVLLADWWVSEGGDHEDLALDSLSTVVERIVAERVRVVEGERDAARSEHNESCATTDQFRDQKARTESAEAAHRALQAAVEALCDAAEWSTEHSLSRTFTGEKFPATVFVSSLRALLGGAR